MSSSDEAKKEHCSGSGRHGPPSEEQRQKWNAEFKQNFMDEYYKQYGNAHISAEKVWELYLTVSELWHGKRKEQRQESHHEHHSHPPCDHSSTHDDIRTSDHFKENRNRMNNELHQEFLNDFKVTHAATDTIDAEQAWLLVEKVKRSKRDKWEANRSKHGHKHGSGCHGRHAEPHDH